MAITFVGEYKFPTTDDANDTGTTLTFDKDAASVGSPASGDVVVMYAVMRSTAGANTLSITTTGGQTWTEHFDVSPDNIPFAVYSCVFDGTWTADPVITYTGSAAARLLWVTIWRNVDTTDRWDVDPTVVDPATGGDQSFAFNTNTDGALAMLGGGQGDNNTGTVNNSFTAPSGSGNVYWRSSGGADFNIGHAVKIIPTAGAIGTTTFDWAFNESIGYQWYGALKLASTSTPLVIQDASHGHSAENLVLTQHNVLAIADATHGHTADNIALTQHNILVVQDALHGHTADNVEVVQNYDLVIQDALHGHTAENLTLTQHNVLAIQDALHGHTADNLDLVQHNILVIQDALHGHTADNILLTQHNVLAIQDALHAHTADNVVLTAHDTLTLAIADALHGHTAENLTLIEHNILAIQDALHGHMADNLTLTQHNILAIADALHNHLADNIVLIPEGEEPDGEQHYVRLRRRKGRWNTHTRS